MISRRIAALVLFVTVACIAGAGIVRARGQSTVRPGEPTLARVWVENRAPNEAVPVVVESLPSPLTVRVDGVVRTAATVQNWSYRTAQFPPGAAGENLNAPYGNEGWEAVGVVQTGANGATILFKKPR